MAGATHMWLDWCLVIDGRLVLGGDTFISVVSLYDGPDGAYNFPFRSRTVSSFRTWDSNTTFKARKCAFGEDHSCDTGSALFVARASRAVIGCLRVPLIGCKAAFCSSALCVTFDVHANCLLLCAQSGMF